MTSSAIVEKSAETASDIAPSRLHHFNYTCSDPQKTRQFYEDILGLPLVAFWCEHTGGMVIGHSFYGLKDGSMLAFIHAPDPELAARLAAPKSPESVHLALHVTEDVQRETVRKLRSIGQKVMEIDHGFVKSIYFEDPDGLTLEYAIDPQNIKDVYEEQKGGNAHRNMERYLSGDYTCTNKYLPEAQPNHEWR